VPRLDEDYLILSTIHSAKGQEWRSVTEVSVAGSRPLLILRAVLTDEITTAARRFSFFRKLRRSARLHHLQSCGTLERCDAPNDKTTRRRCWSRHLGLHHCHRSMLRLPRGSPSHATSQGRSSTWTTPNFGGCSRPLPSRSIAANKALPRTKPLRLRRPGRHHWANLRRSAIRPEGLTSFRNSKSHSGVVPGGGQAGGHCAHVSNIPVLGKSHSKRDGEAKTIG
jgi:hypothetical protein